MYIQLNGVRFSNNSFVAITDIGEDDASVHCITDKIDCCGRFYAGYAYGEWYFPNQTVVHIQGEGGSFYRNRGPSVVRLHRRHNATMPTGSFCCEVPDSSDMNQRICIIVEVSLSM